MKNIINSVLVTEQKAKISAETLKIKGFLPASMVIPSEGIELYECYYLGMRNLIKNSKIKDNILLRVYSIPIDTRDVDDLFKRKFFEIEKIKNEEEEELNLAYIH